MSHRKVFFIFDPLVEITDLRVIFLFGVCRKYRTKIKTHNILCMLRYCTVKIMLGPRTQMRPKISAPAARLACGAEIYYISPIFFPPEALRGFRRGWGPQGLQMHKSTQLTEIHRLVKFQKTTISPSRNMAN